MRLTSASTLSAGFPRRYQSAGFRSCVIDGVEPEEELPLDVPVVADGRFGLFIAPPRIPSRDVSGGGASRALIGATLRLTGLGNCGRGQDSSGNGRGKNGLHRFAPHS